jgi:hypothetical protein
MIRSTQKWAWTGILLLLCVLAGTPAAADQYPGVYSNDDSLIFIQGNDEYGGINGIVVLSYEFSMDWVITVADHGAIAETGLVLADGNRYVYNADGTRNSEMEFTSLEIDTDWNDLEFRVLPSYGHYLAPMVHGGLAYAMVEMSSGLPSQLVLASDAFDSGETINLFEGFIYQISGGELTAQIAFTEVAFGTQGLVIADFPENFPPPPEEYPSQYPQYGLPGYPPPIEMTSETSGSNEPDIFDPFLPQGTEIPPEEQLNRPHFTLEPMHDYDVPAISRIGVVAFRTTADSEDYGPLCDEYLQEALGGIEGVEVVYIPFDSAQFGGAVMYDRAAWLCGQYGVDALLMSEIDELDVPGGLGTARTSGTVRVNTGISGRLIEGVGGSTVWDGSFESNRIHDYYEAEQGVGNIIRGDLFSLVGELTDDIVAQGALDARHID